MRSQKLTLREMITFHPRNKQKQNNRGETPEEPCVAGSSPAGATIWTTGVRPPLFLCLFIPLISILNAPIGVAKSQNEESE